MEYCNLGNSGLEVARLGLGTIPFGTILDDNACQRFVDTYEEAGGNLVDTSNLYGGGSVGTNTETAGTAERAVAKALKGKRHRFVVATKGYWLMQDEVRPNSVGLSRTYLATQIEASLRRLETDYIDLYQCHNWDLYTPVEETMRVLDDFVRAGKIPYVGVSNWDGWHIVKANCHARSANLTPIFSNQIWYNLADRGAENSIIPACQDQSVSIIVWGALGIGFLTGKYRRGDEEPVAGARLWAAKDEEMFSWQRLANEQSWATLDELSRIAKLHDQTIPNVAMRWLLQSGKADVVLLGATRLEQFNSNMDVVNFRLTDQDMQDLTTVSEQPHPYPINFYDIFCRRESALYGGLR